MVVSTFGVIFAADQARAAAEMARVCKPVADSPALWGTQARIVELFEGHASSVSLARRDFVFRYRTPTHWLEVFKACYGPLLEIFAALEHAAVAALERDLVALVDQFNRSGDDSMAAPGEYLEIIIALQ